MIYLRSFLFQLFFWLWSVVWAIGMIGTYPLPRRANTWSLSTWSKGLIWGLRWLAGVKVEVRGEPFRPTGPALVAAKHQSMFDVFSQFALLPDACFVMKKELLMVPLFGWHGLKAGMIVVDRAGHSTALKKLVRDAKDRMKETRQVVIWAMGPAHVEKLLGTLRDNWRVSVEVEPVRTSLRETFLRSTEAHGRLVKQSGGHGQYAVCKLQIEPLERGAGIEFTERVVGGAVPRQYIPSVEKGVRTQLEKGLLAGYPVVDVRVTLVDGKAHSVDSSDMAFQTAGGLALREAANTATVAILEPIDTIDITVADDSVGSVLADLRGRRGQVHGTETADLAGYTVIHAEVPAHELSRYPIDLRSVSHGTGTFTRSFSRYDYMPAALARDLVSA